MGVNHPRVKFRVPIKRVFMERFPFAVVFFVDADAVRVVAVEALIVRELPEPVHDAARSETDPDRRIVAMLGARGKTVPKTSSTENKTSGIAAARSVPGFRARGGTRPRSRRQKTTMSHVALQSSQRVSSLHHSA